MNSSTIAMFTATEVMAARGVHVLLILYSMVCFLAFFVCLDFEIFTVLLFSRLRALSSIARGLVVRGVVSGFCTRFVHACEVNNKVASQMLDDVTLSRLEDSEALDSAFSLSVEAHCSLLLLVAAADQRSSSWNQAQTTDL